VQVTNVAVLAWKIIYVLNGANGMFKWLEDGNVGKRGKIKKKCVIVVSKVINGDYKWIVNYIYYRKILFIMSFNKKYII